MTQARGRTWFEGVYDICEPFFGQPASVNLITTVGHWLGIMGYIPDIKPDARARDRAVFDELWRLHLWKPDVWFETVLPDSIRVSPRLRWDALLAAERLGQPVRAEWPTGDSRTRTHARQWSKPPPKPRL